MPTFSAPMIDLYSRGLSRAVTFYASLGFVETFRTPASGESIHVELTAHDFLDGTLRSAGGIVRLDIGPERPFIG